MRFCLKVVICFEINDRDTRFEDRETLSPFIHPRIVVGIILVQGLVDENALCFDLGWREGFVPLDLDYGRRSHQADDDRSMSLSVLPTYG